MKNTFAPLFSEIRELVRDNPSLESRATTVQHRILRLYREAIAANDMQAVKGITDEWGKQEVNLGAVIAGQTASAAG